VDTTTTKDAGFRERSGDIPEERAAVGNSPEPEKFRPAGFGRKPAMEGTDTMGDMKQNDCELMKDCSSLIAQAITHLNRDELSWVEACAGKLSRILQSAGHGAQPQPTAVESAPWPEFDDGMMHINSIAPLPWKLNSWDAIFDAKGNEITECYGKGIEKTEKAQYIVRAVNAHESLMAALRRIKDARDSIAAGDIPLPLQDRQFDDWAADVANDAIAKAESSVTK
jgi:hypothetical protein